MQFLNDSLLLVLRNNLNTSQIQNLSTKYVDELFEFFKNDKVLDEYYDKYYNKSFPMYPAKNYRIITSLRNFSTMKIKTVIDSNLDVIQNNLHNSVLTTKSYTDNIPKEEELLKVANYIQNVIYDPSYINYTFLNFPNSNFTEELNLMGYVLNTTNETSYHNSLNSFNIVDIFTLYHILFYIFNNSTNFYNVVIRRLHSLNNINKTLMKNDFYEFINHSHIDLSKLFSTFVLKNSFNMFSPCETIQDGFCNFIKTEIYPDLIDVFNDFIDNDIQQDFKKEFNLNYINIIRNITFYNIFQDIIKNDVNLFFNSGTRDKRFDFIFSENYVNDFLNKYKTGNNIKNYLMPIYLYKNDCLKFLNTIQSFIYLYYTNELKPKLDYVNQYRYRGETKSIINSITSKLNINYIKFCFDSYDLSQNCKDNNIPQFISFLFGNDMIQKFCNSEKFNNFVISFLNKSNDYLYKEKLIHYTYNWYVNIELIKHYFLIYFLKHTNIMNDDGLRQNIIFPNLEPNISIFLDDELQFSATEDNISNTLVNLQNNTNILNNTYYLCGNVLESIILRKIYFQVLSYFSNE